MIRILEDLLYTQCLINHEQLVLQAWTSAEIFPRGGKVEILLTLFRLLTMQYKWRYTKHFTFSTPQRKCPMLRQQLHTVFSL